MNTAPSQTRSLPWTDRASEGLSPILVKEVRQSLRGRYFRFSYLFTLFTATTIAIFILIAQSFTGDDESGQIFFLSIYACMTAAVCCFVPFASFMSMSAEWDQNTFDLLILSNLRPKQIVWGKLCSAITQILLYQSAFGPFLVFSFLLRGIDLLGILLLVVGSFVFAVTLTAFSIGLSSLSQMKLVRVVLMALLSFALVWATVGGIAFAVLVVEDPGDVYSDEGMAILSGLLMGMIALTGLSIAVACVRLSHPEENRSTGLRLFTTILFLGFLGWVGFGRSISRDDDWLALPTVAAFFLFIPAFFFITEAERMGRRVSLYVPRNRFLALLATPYLPGGGRGLVFLLLHVALIAAATPLIEGLGGPMAVVPDFDPLLFVVCASVYVVSYLTLPSLFLTSRTHTLRGRVIARSLTVLLIVLCFLGPTLVGFMRGLRDERLFEHALYPVWPMIQLAITDERAGGVRSLTAAAIVALALVAASIPRIVKGITEVLIASRARRERDAEKRREASTPQSTVSLPLES